MRDLVFERVAGSPAPPLVRRYREAAREAFEWANAREYVSRVRRWRRLAPMVAAAQALRCVLRDGRRVPQPGPSLWSQWRAIALLAKAGVRPWDYHRFGLFERDPIAASHAVSHVEAASIHLYLHQNCDFKAVDDEVRLLAKLATEGIPTLPTVTAVLPGSDPEQIARLLPGSDLFVKRVDDGWGPGSHLLERHEGTDSWSERDGPAIDRSTLARRLVHEATKGVLLVQPWSRTGGSIADLSQRALCTLHVVTARCRRGESPSVLAAVARMPATADAVTDSFARGGIAAPVLGEDGLLGPGRMRQDFAIRLLKHPLSGAAIAGRRIEEYAEVGALARRAHALFPEILTAGWDIAITAHGPVVAQGNVLWCVGLVQCASREPLLATAYGDAARAWLGS